MKAALGVPGMSRPSPILRPPIGIAVLTASVCLILAAIVGLGVLDVAELQGFDLLVRLRGFGPPPENLVIVDFDTPTVQSMGTFPIPRNRVAEVIEKISAGAPELIGLDLLLSEKRETAEDQRLAEALTRAQNVVLVETFETEKLPRAEPLPEFRKAALAVGFANILPDQDGFCRRMFLSLSWPEYSGDSFPLVMAMNHVGQPLQQIGKMKYRLGTMEIHLAGSDDKTALIGAWNPQAAGTLLPAQRLLSGEYDSNVFRGKIVLVGQSSASAKDLYATPLFRYLTNGRGQTLQSGVEIHAAAISSLLQGKTIRPAGNVVQWMMSFALVLLVCVLVVLLRPLYSLSAVAAAALGVFLFAAILFSTQQVWIKFVSSELGILLALTAAAGYRFVREQNLKAAMERELSLARSIQQALLPESLPAHDGLEIAVRYESCLEVGGDYYDFLRLDDARLLLVVADVQGHGVASALIMTNFQATLRALLRAQGTLPLARFVTLLDESFYASTGGRKLVTMFLGLLDLPRRKMQFVNAGHVVPMVLRAVGKPLMLTDGGPLLGLGIDRATIPGLDYESGSVQLLPGDLFLAFTDGITEASNEKFEEYTTERVLRAATLCKNQPAQEIVEAVFDDVARFERRGPHDDDKVLMVIKIK